MDNVVEAFQKQLGYKFKNPAFVVEALTHKSFCIEENKEKADNERLEFLGDAILNFVVAEKLLEVFPDQNEGFLSKKRAALVNLSMLAEIAKRFSLEKYMFFGPGEVKQGNHLNPRIQGSCIEALIGAIYLDSGLGGVRDWILSQYSEQTFVAELSTALAPDFKTRLQELTQKYKLGTPVYDLLLTTGPSHKPQFLVSLKLNDEEKSRADGPSKKAAEQRAAELFLGQLTKTLKEDT